MKKSLTNQKNSLTKTYEQSIMTFVKPYGFIYEILNIVNGKRYIGQTVNPKGSRFYPSLNTLKNRYWTNKHLLSSFEKYGINKFDVKTIDFAKSQEELDKKEEYYIKKFGTLDRNYGYNMKHGGSYGKHTEETKKKISNSMKGRIFSEEHKRKLNEARKGRHHSEETKAKLSKANKGNIFWLGRHHSEESKAKMSKARKLYWKNKKNEVIK